MRERCSITLTAVRSVAILTYLSKGRPAAGAAANAAGAAGGNAAAAAAGGTTLMAGGSAATWVSNFLTSSAGIATVATIMATPIIAKAVNGTLIENPAEGLSQEQADLFERALKGGGKSSGKSLKDMVTGLFGGEKAEVPVEPVAEEGSAEKIAGEIGTVTVPATLDWRPSYMTGYGQQTPGWGGHANGLPFVPNDGYLAILHRGERVLTASQNRSYTANSNLYVENMHMGGGMDAKALAEAMSAQNRRVSAGFGS